ncbi:two component transcriptional regulator, winged helix family [Alteromonadaceae bacterium Bs31]|nr:two component transcriptional regulator, winged helix family [Alteromonadaceae bacterium Bs31]
MNTNTPEILLVDDDQELCSLLAEYLQTQGLLVKSVHNGDAALASLLESNNFSVVVLDIMMPGLSGLEVLQGLRAKNDIPVIMLTGRGDDIDRIIGLEMGADDYLGKPCNPRELLARIRAILRRTAPKKNETQILKAHNIQLDPGALAASINGESLHLTNAEFSTLHMLMHNIGQTLTKQELTEKVLQRKLEAYDRSMDVHISRLRNKLAEKGLDNIIQSVRGRGYQMVNS